METETNPETTPKPRDPRALNAYRHGLTGQVVVIPPSERQAYEQHCRIIIDSIAPVGGLETNLAQAVADDRWRLQRAAAIETNLFALGLSEPDEVVCQNEEPNIALAQARVFRDQQKSLQLLTLYEARLQRKIDKNLAHIAALQQARESARQKAVEEIARLTQAAAAQGETYDPATQYPFDLLPSKFVFSPSELVREGAHYARLAQSKIPVARAIKLSQAA